jgi:hypothetical protein
MVMRNLLKNVAVVVLVLSLLNTLFAANAYADASFYQCPKNARTIKVKFFAINNSSVSDKAENKLYLPTQLSYSTEALKRMNLRFIFAYFPRLSRVEVFPVRPDDIKSELANLSQNSASDWVRYFEPKMTSDEYLGYDINSEKNSELYSFFEDRLKFEVKRLNLACLTDRNIDLHAIYSAQVAASDDGRLFGSLGDIRSIFLSNSDCDPNAFSYQVLKAESGSIFLKATRVRSIVFQRKHYRCINLSEY